MAEWQGFYSTAQVSRLARVPQRTLYEWKKRGIIAPSVQVLRGGELVADEGYSYADLTIIKIMRALRNDRLDLRSVGIALRHLFDRLGPPSQGWHDAHVYIVGNKVFAEQQDGWDVTAATQFGQRVEKRSFGDLFEDLRNQDERGSAEFSRYIDIRPDVMGGQPVVKDTRVPTSILATLVVKGHTLQELAELYSPISFEAIQAAVDYEASLAQPIKAGRLAQSATA